MWSEKLVDLNQSSDQEGIGKVGGEVIGTVGVLVQEKPESGAYEVQIVGLKKVEIEV